MIYLSVNDFKLHFNFSNEIIYHLSFITRINYSIENNQLIYISNITSILSMLLLYRKCGMLLVA